MHYLYLAALGFAVGLIARILMPGRDPMGIIMTTLLGVVGAFVGAYGADYLGIATRDTWQMFGIALAGAFAVLAVFKLIRNV